MTEGVRVFRSPAVLYILGVLGEIGVEFVCETPPEVDSPDLHRMILRRPSRRDLIEVKLEVREWGAQVFCDDAEIEEFLDPLFNGTHFYDSMQKWREKAR